MVGKEGQRTCEEFQERREEHQYQYGRGWISSKWFEELGRVAAKQIHSLRSSEKVCKDWSGKDALYPVILTWTPLNTQASTIYKHTLQYIFKEMRARA